MGAADEAHKDRPDASLVEDFPAKGNTVAKKGGRQYEPPRNVLHTG